MSTSNSARILVVENELIIAADIETRLCRIGYKVVGIASQASEAIRMAGSLRPDLVLMDIRLDKSDGIEAASSIREEFGLPVVFLTAHADESTLQRAKESEPFGYVLKPFEERELRTTIEMALYKHAAEHQLRISERWYATTLASIGDGVVATDNEGKVTYLNPVAQKLTGWAFDDALGRPLADVFVIVNEHTRSTVVNPVEKVLASGRVVGLANSTVLISRDRKEYPIDDCASPIYDDENIISGVVLVFRDVTQERQREEALRHAQKMEAVGRLAGGVAHDFNNLLAVINGYCALLLNGIGTESPWREPLVEINHASERAAELTRQLLAFGRNELVQPRPIDLNQVVREGLRMVERLLDPNIEVVSDFHEHTATIIADPGQMEQVLVNLVLNARDAMPNGGRLEITIRTVESNLSDPTRQDEGTYVELIVADNGVGMDPVTKSRIFEPFFSTKETGQGTGLGLASVYGIIQKIDGQISVDSSPNMGTTFSVKFPATTPAPPREPSIASPFSSTPGGTETILLVEDIEAVRKLTSRLLRSGGYTVLEACNGIEAIDIVSRYSGRIDLLATDIVMPHMSGPALAEIISARSPGVRVLYITGYINLESVIDGEGISENHVLHKPFKLAELAQSVRTVLDQPPKRNP